MVVEERSETKARRRSDRSGLVLHPGRLQPWTVWVEGEVVGFHTSRREAERLLLRELVLRLEQRGKLTPAMRALAEAEMRR